MNLDLSYSAGLGPVFHFVPSGYVLDGTTEAELLLRTRDGAELYRSGDGISVVEITLTKSLRFGDGTVLSSGSTVKALRVAPSLSAVDPPLADPANKVPVGYRYGLCVGTAAGWNWEVQGQWTVNPDTGPVRGMCGPQAVCVGPVMVAVNVCGVSAGSGQLGDIDQPATAALAGQMRYQQPGSTGSVLQICMRNATGGYVWTDITGHI